MQVGFVLVGLGLGMHKMGLRHIVAIAELAKRKGRPAPRTKTNRVGSVLQIIDDEPKVVDRVGKSLVAILTDDTRSDFDDLEEDIAADEDKEFDAYLGSPRFEPQLKVTVDGQPAEAFARDLDEFFEAVGFDHPEDKFYPSGCYAQPSTIEDKKHQVEFPVPPIRRQKERRSRGGNGPGNHVNPRVQAQAPAVLKKRKSLKREFDREIRENPGIYDAECLNCKYEIPHTSEGRMVVLAIVAKEVNKHGGQRQIAVA